MLELTQKEREQIQQEIELVKSSQPLKVQNTVSGNMPIAPDGKNAVQDLEQAISAQATPDERETRKIKKRIKGIWRKWRSTTLDAKSLEIEKIACQIEIERAETKAKLNKVKREEKELENAHWLRLNAGNLKDLGYNTESKPSKFWYNLNRGFYHITKLTGNIPKLIKNLFWVGIVVVGVVLLKHFNVL